MKGLRNSKIMKILANLKRTNLKPSKPFKMRQKAAPIGNMERD